MHSPTLRLPDGAHKGERGSTDNPLPSQEAHRHLPLVAGSRLSDGPLHWHSHASPVGREIVPSPLLPPPQRHHRHLLRRKPHPRRLPSPPHSFNVRTGEHPSDFRKTPTDVLLFFRTFIAENIYRSAALHHSVVPHYGIV